MDVPAVNYQEWSATCDTLHAHTQVLGKLAATLAPPQPQLQHAALRLTARGWETLPLPASDRGGALVAGLDLRTHGAFVEHSDGREARVALTPDRSVGAVARELLGAFESLGGPAPIDAAPQEVWWDTPLDQDEQHTTYDTDAVSRYFHAATLAALVLDGFRAPYRGRSTPVNAWWGSFDLAVSLFSGESADPPSAGFIMRNSMDVQEVAVGWWPGDPNHGKAAFYAYAHPAPDGFAGASLGSAGRWDDALGEYLLDWDEVRTRPDPRGAAVHFARAVFRHACAVCEWDPALSASADSIPPPVS